MVATKRLLDDFLQVDQLLLDLLLLGFLIKTISDQLTNVMILDLVDVVFICFYYILVWKEHLFESVEDDSVFLVLKNAHRIEKLVHFVFCEFDLLLHDQTVQEVSFGNGSFSSEINSSKSQISIRIHLLELNLQLVSNPSTHILLLNAAAIKNKQPFKFLNLLLTVQPRDFKPLGHMRLFRPFAVCDT